jgi:hypothetical protein
VVPHQGKLYAVPRQRSDVDGRPHGSLRLFSECAGREHLLDGAMEAVGVGQHDGVELLAPALVDVPRLQRLQIQTHRCDRSFQLMRDRVDEGVVIFVALDLKDQKHRIDDEPGDDEREDDDAEDERRDATGVDDDPADVQRYRGRDQQDAQGDKEGNGLLPTGHRVIVVGLKRFS